MNMDAMSAGLVARVGGVALAAVVVSNIIKIVTTPVVKLPYEKLFAIAKKQNSTASNEKYPLKGKIAIVTGSTNGLGEQIAKQLYRLGATVVIASRTYQKCVDTAEKIDTGYPESCGKILSRTLDTSDLDSVKQFVEWYRTEFEQLHYLINNAGIVYLPNQPKPTPEAPFRSKQGYDQCFATNYLGHYLLTELLTPMLKATGNARIVFIASSAHLQVGGQSLQCHNGTPDAARSDVFTASHWITAYGNSKMAQLLHMKVLNARLQNDADSNGLKVVSVCPGFVNTGMVPDGPMGKFLAPRFYPVEAGAYVPLYAALAPDNELKGGEFLTNFYNYWSSSVLGAIVYRLCAVLGLRSYFIGLFGIPWIIAFQHTSYGIHRTPVSEVASDAALASEFMTWSEEITKEYKK